MEIDLGGDLTFANRARSARGQDGVMAEVGALS
jgi:hypothetical protein